MEKRRIIMFIGAVVVFIVGCIIIEVVISMQRGPRTDIYAGLKAFPEGDICFNSSDPSSYEKYNSKLEEFIKPYKEMTLGGRVISCDKRERKDDEICYIDQTWIYPCGDGGWGYEKGKPCVIIYYSDDSTYEPFPYALMEELPDDAPRELKEYMEDEAKKDDGYINFRMVRLYCTHSDLYDYHPSGFYMYFFPISKLEGSLPPIASVQFDFQEWNDEGKMFFHTGEYDVECSLWSEDPDVREVKKLSFKIKHGNC